MQIELDHDELEYLIEGLDSLKTKMAFTKGPTSAEKNAKIRRAEAIEVKLLQASKQAEE